MKKKPILSAFAVFFIMLLACNKEEMPNLDYRAEMRDFVISISQKGRAHNSNFIVIPQNALALITQDGKPDGTVSLNYLNAIDGIGQEELFYGYDNNDDMLSPDPEHSEWLSLAERARDEGKKMLITDYVSSSNKIQDSWQQNYNRGFISFAATSRELDLIPSVGPFVTDTNQINSLADAQNFLYIISTGNYQTKEEMISALSQTPHDVIIMDLFFDEENIFTANDLSRLRNKPQGGTRKLICYMSIGQAESYRWYWKNWWTVTPPSFLIEEDPNWVDNYYVRYWDPAWQQVFIGATDSYMNRILDAGFDGVYLDLVNAYEYFEE
jgi:cysteinyl-tRNA synthetase, unknown class